MLKLLAYYTLLILSPNVQDESLIEQHVEIEISRFEYNGEMQISVLPKIKKSSAIYPYKRRFSYLLLNLPALHQSENREKRKTLNALFPDTVQIKNRYLNAYGEDKKLSKYFKATYRPIQNINYSRKFNFSKKELMDVASKFFFCDKIFPDTSIQAHVCIGLNGVKEANWKKDLTLLEAFCYEAIFYGIMDDDNSNIWATFTQEKKNAVTKYKKEIKSLDQFLTNVKLDVFERMNKSTVLKSELLDYYEKNKSNLAFTID